MKPKKPKPSPPESAPKKDVPKPFTAEDYKRLRNLLHRASLAAKELPPRQDGPIVLEG